MREELTVIVSFAGSEGLMGFFLTSFSILIGYHKDERAITVILRVRAEQDGCAMMAPTNLRLSNFSIALGLSSGSLGLFGGLNGVLGLLVDGWLDVNWRGDEACT